MGKFQINVARHGDFFFCTEEQFELSPDAMKIFMATFKDKFPATEGYSISLITWSDIKRSRDIKN